MLINDPGVRSTYVGTPTPFSCASTQRQSAILAVRTGSTWPIKIVNIEYIFSAYQTAVNSWNIFKRPKVYPVPYLASERQKMASVPKVSKLLGKIDVPQTSKLQQQCSLKQSQWPLAHKNPQGRTTNIVKLLPSFAWRKQLPLKAFNWQNVDSKNEVQ